MKALGYHKFGDADVIGWTGGWSVPEPGDKDVLIQVFAGGINPKDILLRKGKFSKTLARDPLPRISGLDVAGKIVKTGKKCTRFKKDDLVFGMTNRFSGGLHAEFAVLHQDEIALKPDLLSLEESAAIPLAAQTALQALRDCAGTSDNSSVMINGASGGVGHFAVQIAKALGNHVTAVCSSKNQEFAYELGADKAIDYNQSPPHQLTKTFDCIFDVFGQYSAENFKKQLNPNGVYVSTVPKFSTIWGEALARIKLNRSSRLVFVKSRTRNLETLSTMIAEKKLKPFIDEIYSFADGPDAHRHIESKHTKGKIAFSLAKDKK